MKKTTIIFVLLSMSFYAFSQLEEDVKTLDKRVKELESIKNRWIISGTERTLNSFPKVKVNFNTPNFITIPDKIKNGDFYQVVIEDINLNIYRVELQNSDTIYSSSLDLPVFGTIDLSTLEGIIGTFNIPELIENIENKSDPLTKELFKNLKLIQKVNSEDFEKAFGNPENSVFFENYFKKQIEEAETNKKHQEAITVRLKQSKNKTTQLNNQLKELNLEIDKLFLEFSEYRIKARTYPVSVNEKNMNIGVKLQEYRDIRTKLEGVRVSYSKEKSIYDNFFTKEEYMKLLKDEDYSILSEQKEKIDKGYEEIKKLIDKFEKLVSTSSAEKTIVSVYQLYTENKFTSLPIQFHGDEAEVKVSFIPKDSASNLQTYHLSPIRFPKKNWYWSIGTSLYHSYLSNQRVGFKTVPLNDTTAITDSTKQYMLLKEDDLHSELGVAALLHAGWQFKFGLGFHASVGTGLSLGSEVRARILYGVGISFGQRHSLTLDVGAISGYVDRISEHADFENPYALKPQPLITELKTELFWAVGYTFRL